MGSASPAEKTSNHDEGAVAVDAARNAVTGRLFDSLLHDVRNPLNALSINLDVLTEKLRREQGEIPPAQEKNLKVMREQVFRVDGILKRFAEFIAPRDGASESACLSDEVLQALHILGHECRRSMIKVRQIIEPDLKVAGSVAAVRFLVLQAIFRGVARASQEGELDVSLQRDGDRAILRIRDSGKTDANEPFGHARAALDSLASQLDADLRMAGSELQLTLSLI